MVKTQKNKNKSRLQQRKSRRKIGTRMYKNYTEEMLRLACESVETGQISSRDAERQFGNPRRTIVNKIKHTHSKSVGHPTALSAEEESQIVRVLQSSSDFGTPLTKMDLKLLVHEYAKKNSRDHIFKNQIPGDAWVQGFLARHSDELSLRTTQNISKVRAEKGPKEIAEYFDNLSTTLKDIPAENIVNFDETNLSDDPGSSKCIFRRGVKYPERIANSTKGNISLMFTAIASGECLPLYVVYKSTNLYSEWVSGGPPETRYNCTKSGWFDSATFENYFETIILPWAQNISGTKVVICDNLSSHISVKVVELCQQNDIKFVFIPPRSTHLTQPLDVAFFAPLKKAWRKILYQYKLRNPNQTTLNKKHFLKLLGELMEAIQGREAKNIKSGFRASGIFPFNPQEVLRKIPEMQEEILSYGIDTALIDFLKETRAPKPMPVKRNKRVNCEPGRSVTFSDLNIDVNKSILTNKSSRVAKNQKKTKDSLFLDEETGLFVAETGLTSNNHIYEEQESFGNNLDSKGSFATSQNQDIYSPESLSKLCIIIINSCCQAVNYETPLSTFADFSHINTSTIRPMQSGPAKKSKITILSDVIIKAGTSNVCVLKEASNKIENTPFVATSNSDLPVCLQVKKTKQFKKVKKEYSRRGKKINRKDQVTNLKGKTSVRGASMKKRHKRSDSESSSSFADNEVVTVDTDDSDYATVNDYYIAECLREQEEKENFEPVDISLGLHEIEYLTENEENLKENDWIIARFATKKSLKHYVGNILAINDKIPTVKFVRKVKESKCEEGTTFTYPLMDDICTMQHVKDVITILPKPKIIRRGRMVFNVDFSNFNVQ